MGAFIHIADGNRAKCGDSLVLQEVKELLYDMTILLLGVHLEELKTSPL